MPGVMPGPPRLPHSTPATISASSALTAVRGSRPSSSADRTRIARTSASCLRSSASLRAFTCPKTSAIRSSSVACLNRLLLLGLMRQRPTSVSRSSARRLCETASRQKLSSTMIRSGDGRSLLRRTNMAACGRMRIAGALSRNWARYRHVLANSHSSAGNPPSPILRQRWPITLSPALPILSAAE